MKAPLLTAALLMPLLSSAALADPRAEVMAADRAFSALSVAKGSAFAFWATVAKDGRLYGPSGPPEIGKAAAARNLDPKADPRRNILSWDPTAGGASADGQLGWTDGRWKLTGARSALTGHYVTVWVKEAGGWKVQADIGTTDPAPGKDKKSP